MTLTEADSLAPEMKVAKVLKSLAPSDFEIKRLINMSPSYFKEMNNITSNTPKEVIQTYLLWKTIQAYSPNIESDILKPYKRFLNELQGKVYLFHSYCPELF